MQFLHDTDSASVRRDVTDYELIIQQSRAVYFIHRNIMTKAELVFFKNLGFVFLFRKKRNMHHKGKQKDG